MIFFSENGDTKTTTDRIMAEIKPTKKLGTEKKVIRKQSKKKKTFENEESRIAVISSTIRKKDRNTSSN